MRLFIGIELPEHVKNRIAFLQEDLDMPGAPFKAVNKDNLHITLKFLGSSGEKEASETEALLRETAAEAGPFALSFKGTGVFPSSRRPLVVWAGVADEHGGLLRLRARLEETLSRAGFKEEKKSYHPHITIARLRKGAKPPDAEKLEAWLKKNRCADSGRMEVRGIALIESILSAEGASYRPIARAAVAGGA